MNYELSIMNYKPKGVIGINKLTDCNNTSYKISAIYNSQRPIMALIY